MDEQQQDEAPPRRRGANWLGLIAFIVIAFGQRIVGFAQWLFSGGAALLPGNFDMALVLGGGAVLAIIVATVVTLRASRGGDARGPMLPSPALSSSRAPALMALPVTVAQRPSAPRFEPIISGKAVLASVLLALLAGAALAAFLLVAP